MTDREYITVRELARYLSVKEKTVYSWVESGKIPAYKICGALRFSLKEINAFIQKSRVKPVDAEKQAKKIIGGSFFFGHNLCDSGQKTPR